MGSQAVTFIGADHFTIFQPDVQSEIGRFAVAFLTLHLRGDDRSAEILSPQFIQERNTDSEPQPTFESGKYQSQQADGDSIKTSITVTLDIYSHAVPALQADAAEQITALIFNP